MGDEAAHLHSHLIGLSNEQMYTHTHTHVHCGTFGAMEVKNHCIHLVYSLPLTIKVVWFNLFVYLNERHLVDYSA